MIDVGEIIKGILRKRGMSITDLVKVLNRKGLSDGEKMYLTHMSTNLGNNKVSTKLARKIEIGLELEEFSLVNLINDRLNPAQIKRLKSIGKK